MDEKLKEEAFRFIKPVDTLPLSMREKSSFYDQIIDEFINSGIKYAMIKDIDRKPATIAIGLRSILIKRNLKNVTVLQMKNQVYLKKLG